jgi:hypothetical protein
MTNASIGHNSRAAEFAALADTLRVELEAYEMTPLWRARWEILLDQTMAAPDKLIGVIMSFFQEFRGKADPGVKTVEMLSGLADRRVRLGVKLNEDRGFLVKERGGHRGQASVFSVQIPEKTLRELAERRQARAANNEEKGGIGGTGGTVEPPLPPLKGGIGGTVMPPFSATYIDINNNINPVVDVVEGAHTATVDPVYVNGVGILGPGFKIDHEMIRVAGEVNAIPQAKRLILAELIARRWASLNEKPASVMDALSRAMAGQRVRLATDEAKLAKELEKLKAEQTTPQPPPRASPRSNMSYAAQDQARADEITEFLRNGMSQ